MNGAAFETGLSLLFLAENWATHCTCPLLYPVYFSPKMRGLTLRRKTDAVSVEVFTFHVHLKAFERHTGTEGRREL